MKKLMLLIIPLLFSCETNNKDKSVVVKPHEYSEIDFLKINWDDLFNQKETKYLVYFYGDHCSHCFDIKNEVISYALNGQNKIYFCNDTKITFFEGDVIETIGKIDVSGVFINGTPSVIEIENKTVKDNVCGSNKVLKKIRGE